MTLDEMLSRLGHREHSMRAVIKELPPNAMIVETGCIRQRDNWVGDGQSTLIWQECAEIVYSIDIDSDAVALARSLTDPEITRVYCSDSVKFLWEFQQQIDLLYLDSFDFDCDQPWASAIHHLHELCAALKNLHERSIVMVDDTAINPQGGGVFGKGMLIFSFMQKIGAQLIVSGPHQMAWRMSNATSAQG